MDFFFANPSVSLFQIEICSLAPCSQIPHSVFFFNTSDHQVRFLLLCENIFLFPTHFEVFFFISTNILIPRTFPTSSSPLHIFFFACNVFISVPDVFNFSYRTQLHEFPPPLPAPIICQLETEPNTCYLVCPRPCIFKTH